MGQSNRKMNMSPHKYFVAIKFCQFSNEFNFEPFCSDIYDTYDGISTYQHLKYDRPINFKYDKPINLKYDKPIIYCVFFFTNAQSSENFLQMVQNSSHSNDKHCYAVCCSNSNVRSSHYITSLSFNKVTCVQNLFDENVHKILGFDNENDAIEEFNKLFELCSDFFKKNEMLDRFTVEELLRNESEKKSKEKLLRNESKKKSKEKLKEELKEEFYNSLVQFESIVNKPTDQFNKSKIYLNFIKNMIEDNNYENYENHDNNLFSIMTRTNDLMYLFANNNEKMKSSFEETNEKIKSLKQENDELKMKINNLEEKFKLIERKIIFE